MNTVNQAFIIIIAYRPRRRRRRRRRRRKIPGIGRYPMGPTIRGLPEHRQSMELEIYKKLKLLRSPSKTLFECVWIPNFNSTPKF